MKLLRMCSRHSRRPFIKIKNLGGYLEKNRVHVCETSRGRRKVTKQRMAWVRKIGWSDLNFFFSRIKNVSNDRRYAPRGDVFDERHQKFYITFVKFPVTNFRLQTLYT